MKIIITALIVMGLMLSNALAWGGHSHKSHGGQGHFMHGIKSHPFYAPEKVSSGR